ncbi:MAG TPA: L,D-transpeptidase family protein [Polyangiaceae bacterium]|nr:L,D-transpeptidase family protein [Polyangiaceae bacterium]
MKITEKWIAPAGCGKNPGKALPAMLRPSTRPRNARAHWSALLLVSLAGCDRAPPPGAEIAPASPSSVPAQPQAGVPTLPKELAAPSKLGTVATAPGAASAAPAAPAGTEGAPGVAPAVPPPDYAGPWLAITANAAGVYAEASFEGKKLGYIRNGGRVAVEPNHTAKKNCTSGWYKLLGGGYVCGNLGTTDLNHPDVKFATQAPNLEEVLPYPYARNAKNGTPLYKSVPSREQMEKYEPYLKAKAEDASSEDERSKKKAKEGGEGGAPSALPARLDAALADAGVALPSAPETADPEPEKPWWQRDDMKDRMHELKLDQLSEDADAILAKRMVSGFYVAVDKTFRWNNRSWYKTTRGLVTPSDRFWQTSGSKFKGVELNGEWKLPLGFVFGGNKSISSYSIDGDKIKPAKTYEHFAPVQLTGKEQEFHGTKYAETGDGSWVKRAQIRSTSPGTLPVDLKPNERWIDVNLSTQTLVAFEGDKAIYATLISSGKESKIKDKDHRTPTGEWHIREKHITTTMDGDGTAAGDLPYSIEDVPYVMYFFRSYATHGAFWHSNFGTQMSHGCVNLSPLDAKYLFFFADPPLPKGWHGVHATEASPGSRIVVHL